MRADVMKMRLAMLLALLVGVLLPGCRARVVVKTEGAQPRAAETRREPLAPAASAAPAPAPARSPFEGWSRVAVARPRTGGALVSAGDRLYLIGGTRSDHGGTGEVDVFDPGSASWTRARPLPRPLAGHAAAALDGKIYVAGGCIAADCARLTGTTLVYDPASDSWRELSAMPEPVVSAGYAALGGRFYVVGGVSKGRTTSAVQVFDPASGSWSGGPRLPGPRTHAAVAAVGGRLYSAGGCVDSRPSKYCETTTDEVLELDPREGVWRRAPSLPRRMAAAGAAELAGRLLVFGGQAKGGAPLFTEAFALDAAGRRWSAVPRLLEAVYVPSAASVDGALFAYGGGENNESLPELQVHGAAFRPVAFAPEDAGAAPAAAGSRRDELEPGTVVPSRGRKGHALIIGVERYREPLPTADFAAADARLMGRYASAVLGLPEENVAVLSDERATRGDFEKYVERWLPNRVEAGDEVFVYFSGHGAPNPKTGDAYLVPYDGDPTYIEQTGYPLRRLYESLGKLPAKRVIVAMDSCFSGAGGRSVLAKGARPLVSAIADVAPPPKLTVIAASAGDQISNSYREKGHGLFTYFFLKGLKEKGPDYKAVFDYLKPEVARVARREYNADQDPQWREGR